MQSVHLTKGFYSFIVIWTFVSSEHTPSLWCGNPSSEEDGWANGRELMKRRLLGALFWTL